MRHFCYITGLYSRHDPLMIDRQGKSLIEAGFKVTYIVCDKNGDENIEGIDIVSTNYVPKNRIDRFVNSKKILIKYAQKADADIYQISDPELISMVIPLKKMGKKVIFNLREFYPDLIKQKSYIPKVFRNRAAYLYGRLMKYFFKKYDAIITPDHYDTQTLIEEYKIKQSYFVANFPRLNNIVPFSYEDYLKRGDVLCYEGSIYASSRQENVFKALELLPSVKYLLAGRIEENYEWIKTLPYWKKLEFIDGFKLEDLPGIFARSSIGNVFRCNISETGSYGVIKIFETMEAGLPVLLSDLPLYREIVKKYHCGICVDPNDVYSIERAIRYLIENKEEAYEMGQNGRRAVIEEYNWENEAKKYISIINKIMQ